VQFFGEKYVFARPRPQADVGCIEIPQRSEPVADPANPLCYGLPGKGSRTVEQTRTIEVGTLGRAGYVGKPAFTVAAAIRASATGRTNRFSLSGAPPLIVAKSLVYLLCSREVSPPFRCGRAD